MLQAQTAHERCLELWDLDEGDLPVLAFAWSLLLEPHQRGEALTDYAAAVEGYPGHEPSPSAQMFFYLAANNMPNHERGITS